MKKNDLLDQFYKKRSSFIFRSFIALTLILLILIVSLKFNNKEKFIAKISIQGIIQDRKDLIDQIDELAKNDNVKGLLSVINSPGGTYVGSKEIYDSIKEISKKIPTAVYMKEMATSGGYLVSLSSDKIYGNAGTITGSVGVILQTVDVSNLLDKLGINPIIVKSGELKAVPNPAEKISSEKLIYLEDLIQKMQKEFLGIVKTNRKVSDSIIEYISDGRVFTGKEAENLKLIDQVGNEKDAIEWLRNEAGLDENVRVKDLSSERNIENILNFSFLKKKINYFNQNFYNGFIAIWTPGI